MALVALMSGSAVADEPPRWELGIRTGFALPFGKLSSDGDDLSTNVSGQIPIWVDGGYRVTPQVVLGVYAQLGILLPKDCPSDVSCSGQDWRFGVNARFHIQPGHSVDPWLGLGVGYELFHGVVSQGGSTASGDAKGWEFANLSAGVDFLVAAHAFIGPYLSFSLDETTSLSATFGGVTLSTSDFDKSLHEWLLFGVRARFDL
jgi:opacity protein-like surface antigen